MRSIEFPYTIRHLTATHQKDDRGFTPLITQRSEVQILLRYGELTYGVGPFLMGRAYVVSRRVAAVVVNVVLAGSAAGTRWDAWDALRQGRIA
jgi:hypothetical protein